MTRFDTDPGVERDVVAARAAVSRLFVSHAAEIFGYAARRLGPDTGADVTADVFIVAMERWHSFDPSLGTELGWLYGIASNLIRRHWRTEERRLRALAAAQSRLNTSADPLLRVEQRADAAAHLAAVVAAIVAMSADNRDLLLLTAWEQLGPADVAEVLGIPVGTVKSRLSRIRASLRRQREEHDND